MVALDVNLFVVSGNGSITASNEALTSLTVVYLFCKAFLPDFKG